MSWFFSKTETRAHYRIGGRLKDTLELENFETGSTDASAGLRAAAARAGASERRAADG